MGEVIIAGLDTNIFLNVLREEESFELTAHLLEQIKSGKIFGVTSTLVLAEIATIFYKEGEVKKGDQAIELLKEIPNLMFVDLTQDIVGLCARLKVDYKLSLADAIILGAAIALNADVFLTRDSDFDKVDIIPIKLPEDFIEDNS